MAITSGALALVATGTSAAATFSANSTATLMSAVADADTTPGSNTIVLAGGATYLPTATLTLSNRSGTTTIEAAPNSTSDQAALDASAVLPYPSDFIDVVAGARVDLKHVTISGAGGSGGYAAISDYGAITLDDVTLQGDVGPSLVVQSGAFAVLNDSTIGEGLDFGIVDVGTTSLFNSTIAYNLGGVDDSVGTLNLTNSIVAENSGGDCLATVSANGGLVDHSLDSDGSCGVAAPLSGVNPQLVSDLGAPVTDGADVPTYPLRAASPAIGVGDESECPSSDERGDSANDPCDIGADAYGAVSPATSGSAGSGAAGGAGGAAQAPGTTTAGATWGVSGHGTIAGGRRSSITFEIRALHGQAHGTFEYTDSARHLRLSGLSLTSVAVNEQRQTAALGGLARNRADGRDVRFTALLDCAHGHRSISVRLSSGYSHAGAVLRGSLVLTSSVPSG